MRLLRVAALFVLAALVVAGRARAEVSATPRNDGRVDTLIMSDVGITDGIDPIPQIWHAFRQLPPDWVLNASGEARGDGRPDLAFHRPSGTPVAVWAYNHGTNHDVAIAHWLGNGWSPTELITNTPDDEVDPRVFVRPDGSLDVVWWVDGQDPRVELTTHVQDGDFWTPPLRVSPLAEPARRPSVARFSGSVWVAYERDSQVNVFNANEVVVRRQNELGSFVVEQLVETEFDGPVEPVLHVRSGSFWLDWRYASEEFAYLELADSTNLGTSIEPWTDASWIGIESVRLLIAALVNSPPAEPGDGDPSP